MPLYEDCQKTLVVDGKIDSIPEDWEAIQVPRVNNQFCWARMWDAGVLSARNEKILYLDSDRMLPINFLEMVYDYVNDNVFLFTSMHFMMTRPLPIEVCKSLLQNTDIGQILADERAMGVLRYENRAIEPHHGSGKNVMSGSTAFTRSTYLRLGGVDSWYCGHGAFADTDFHMQAAVSGCKFHDLAVPELHYPHEKLDVSKTATSQQDIWLMSLDNFIYYCHKWKLPMILAESMASRCGIKHPNNYVSKRRKAMVDAKES